MVSLRPAAEDAPRRRRALSTSLALAALAVLAAFLVGNRDYIAASYAPRPDAFLAIAALVVATLALRSVAHQVLFGRLGIAASAADWFRLVAVSSFTNYLPLSAGMVAKAFFLKRVHSLPYRTFAVGQGALLVVIVSTNGAVGLATLGLAFPEQLTGIIGAGFALMAGTAALMFLPSSGRRLVPERWLPWRPDEVPSLRWAWVAVSVLQAGILLAAAATLWIAFAMGASRVGFAACVVFTAASVLTRLVAITPGAIGIREFLVGGLAYLTGFELRDAVIAATATRTVEVAVVFGLGGIFTRRLSGELMSSYDERREG